MGEVHCGTVCGDYLYQACVDGYVLRVCTVDRGLDISDTSNSPNTSYTSATSDVSDSLDEARAAQNRAANRV